MGFLKPTLIICAFSLSLLNALEATVEDTQSEETVQDEEEQKQEEAQGVESSTQPSIPVTTEAPIGDCYDYIVVGAGSAGSVVANRLAIRGNYTVLLLESGGYPTPNLYVPFYAPFSSNAYNSWQYYTVPQKNSCLSFNDSKAPMTQGKLLGGTSGINSMNMVRGNPSDYDKWEKEYNASGWNYSSILKYFMETENFTINDERIKNVTAYHGKHGETPVNYPNYYTNLSHVFLNACKEFGYEYVDYNGEKKAGYSRTQTNTLNGMRMSAFSCFIHQQSYMFPKLQISTNSTATRIFFDDKNRATTVQFTKNGTSHNVTAGREVVVAAGAIGSAKLLMLSGIGPKDELQKHGITLVSDLPVGDGLQDHVIFLGLVVTTTKDLIGFKDLFDNTSLKQYQQLNRTGLLTLPGAYEAFLFTDSLTNETSPKTPDIALALTALFPSPEFAQSAYVSDETYQKYYKPLIEQNRTGFMTTLTMVQPKSRGTVKLNSSDPHEPPLIDPMLLSVEDDVSRTVKGILKVKKLFETTAMTDIGAKVYDTKLPYCEEFDVWSEDYVRCFLKYAGFPGMHVCCTCAMGNHSKSVVDERLRVKNVSRLRVIDASVMPVITSGNTHAPVMMIGAKGADMIIEDAKAEEMAAAGGIRTT